MKPIFSIIIPCYNQGYFLSDCINSVLNQRFLNWEAIIINDGSTDNTEQIAQSYCSSDKRLRLLNKKNGGLSSARNSGINDSVGEWFIFLDADDCLSHNCLYEVANRISEGKSNSLIRFGYSYFIDSIHQTIHSVVPGDNDSMVPSIYYAPPGPPNSVCISRSFTQKIGLFDEALKALEDWDFWIRAAKAGAHYINIPLPLAFYRQVSGSMSRNMDLMYQNALIVIGRIPYTDPRISFDSFLNRDIVIDTIPILKKVFIRILAVGICQGKINESLNLFNESSSRFDLTFEPRDFEEMCSALTFRYQMNKEEVDNVIYKIRPLFNEFFVRAGYSRQFIDKALFGVFRLHLMRRNQLKFGAMLAKPANLLLRTLHG